MTSDFRCCRSVAPSSLLNLRLSSALIAVMADSRERWFQFLCAKAKKAVLPATSDTVAGNPETSKEQAVKPEASKKQADKDHVCAPCNHQDAINQIEERYVIGSITPHWATTVAGGKDLSV